MFRFLQKLSRTDKTLLFTCFFAFFCNGTLSLTMGSVMPDLKAAYGLSDTLSGVLLSAHSAGNMIAGFVSGVIPLYLGRKRSITLLAATAYIGYLLAMLFSSPVMLIAAFLLTGIGRGSVTNFNTRTVNVLTDGSPAASNLLHAVFAGGAILAPMVFLGLRNAFSWRVGLFWTLGLGCACVVRLATVEMEEDLKQRKKDGHQGMGFLKDPAFRILAMMMFCYLCSEYAINGWLVTYIQHKDVLLQTFGQDTAAQTAGMRAYSQMMATLLWVVMLIGRLACAALSGRFSQRRMMLAFSVGVALFFFLMLMGQSVPTVTCAVAGLGLCMAGICPMIYADAAYYTNTYPLATGTILAIGSVGAIVMPTMVGFVAERLGFLGGMGVILLTMLLLIVFAFLNTVTRRSYERA